MGTESGDLIIGNLLSNVIDGWGGDDVIYGDGTLAIHDPGEADYDQVTNSGDTPRLPRPKWPNWSIIQPGSGTRFMAAAATI
jgi:hypothetical protein